MSFRLCVMLLLLLILSACRRTAPTPEVTTPAIPEVLGIANLDLEAEVLSSQALVPDLGFTLVSSNTFDSSGVRVRQITLEVANNSGQDLDNLTFYSLQTPDTIVGSNVGNLRDAFGTALTAASAPCFAQTIIPVHGQSSVGVIDPDLADMQAFSADDQTRVQALLDSSYPANSFAVLARGFVASNITGQSNRAIAAGETGVVTIAVRYPFDASNPAGYPDTFTLSFAFVNETTPRFSQGNGESNTDFVNRLEAIGIPTTATEIVPSDPSDLPDVSRLTQAPTVITAVAVDPPLSCVPSTPTPPAPTPPETFTLGVATLLVSASVDVEVNVDAAVERTLVWE